jgi:hypothetical protein
VPTQIKTFTHACDEVRGNPIYHYAVIYDDTPQRNLCFGNARIDEQAILTSTQEDSLNLTDPFLPTILEGRDSPYADSIAYFIPYVLSNIAKIRLNSIIHKWMNGKNSGFVYSQEGDIYLALRYTRNGMWVLTYYNTIATSILHDKARNLFKNEFEVFSTENVQEIDMTKAYMAYNMSYCSGYDFFSFFRREKIPSIN